MSGAKSAAPLHDDDGNVTDYKTMKYSWNAENQMISAEPKNPAEGDKKTEYLYDYMGRRARKQISVYSSSAWTKTTEKLFVYDGWNLVKEVTKVGSVSSDKFYVWGLDLSQTLQGAGGVGGLVCAVQAGEVRHYFYDANGNVGQVVNADGSIAAHYEYDPFGNIVNGVSPTDDNPFRFSTKYFDEETGLYYYGFRYYSAELGRWWSRDPLGERGGVNLYGFINNNPTDYTDMLGLIDWQLMVEVWREDWKSGGTERRFYQSFSAMASITCGVFELKAALAGGPAGVYLGMHGVGQIMGGVQSWGETVSPELGAYLKDKLHIQNHVLEAYGDISALNIDVETLSVKPDPKRRWIGKTIFYLTDLGMGVGGIVKEVPECTKVIVKIGHSSVAGPVLERYRRTVAAAKGIRMNRKEGFLILSHDLFQIGLSFKSAYEESGYEQIRELKKAGELEEFVLEEEMYRQMWEMMEGMDWDNVEKHMRDGSFPE